MEHEDDPYRILGLARGAGGGELKRAYRTLSLAWHPDRHLNEPDDAREEAERTFKRIHAAYQEIEAILKSGASIATDPAEAVAITAAIHSAVSSAALRVMARQTPYVYRRVVGVAERLLNDAVMGGEALFVDGLHPALQGAMDAVGMDPPLRPSAIRVVLLATSELPWRGRGPDPEVWDSLLAPLVHALRAARIE